MSSSRESKRKTSHNLHCPICRGAVRFDLRYPDALCDDCAARTVDTNGQAVVFYNEGPSGGLIGVYTTTGGPYESTVCYVDGVECRAAERRMGGVVVEWVK